MSDYEAASESEAEEEVKLHIKYVTNKDKSKVLFAEADSDFIDVLLSFLLLPLGTIMRHLEKQYGDKAPLGGSLTSLYNGVENLDSIHFPTEDARRLLLNPKCHFDDEWPTIGKGFTETTASFIISDDLKVMPSVEGSLMSTLSSLSVAIADMDGALTLKKELGKNEILDLLRESLISSNPLTTFLLRKSRINIAGGEGNALISQIGRNAICLNSKKMFLKVMIENSTATLLFAQAHKDFISFLFGLLSIPLGRVGWYLHSNTGLGALDNLHKSVVDNLYNNHLMSTETKNLLFKPNVPTRDDSHNEFIPLNFDGKTNEYHVRGSRMYMVSDDLTVAPMSLTSSLSVLNALKISFSDVQELGLKVGLEEGLCILKAALTSTTALTDGLIIPLLKNKQRKKSEMDFS